MNPNCGSGDARSSHSEEVIKMEKEPEEFNKPEIDFIFET